MQVAGAQPVGSRGLSGLQVVVTDPPAASRTVDARASAPRPSVVSTRLLTAQPVVFPRDGLPIDQRPAQLRLRKADEKYRESEQLVPRWKRRR